jgi:hypothetical protein
MEPESSEPASSTPAAMEPESEPEPSEAVHIIGTNQDWVFRIQKDYSLYDASRGIVFNGVPLPEGSYKVEEGSTVVTIFAGYLNTLPEGHYLIQAPFIDGDMAEQDIQIAKASSNGNTDNGSTGGNTGNSDGSAAQSIGSYGVSTGHQGPVNVPGDPAQAATDDQFIILEIPFDRGIRLTDAQALIDSLIMTIGGGNIALNANTNEITVEDGHTLRLVMHIPYAPYSGELRVRPASNSGAAGLVTDNGLNTPAVFPSIDLLVPNGVYLGDSLYERGTAEEKARVTKTVYTSSDATRGMVHFRFTVNGQPYGGVLNSYGGTFVAHYHDYLRLDAASFALLLAEYFNNTNSENYGSGAGAINIRGYYAAAEGDQIIITAENAVPGEILDLELVAYGIYNEAPNSSNTQDAGSVTASPNSPGGSSGVLVEADPETEDGTEKEEKIDTVYLVDTQRIPEGLMAETLGGIRDGGDSAANGGIAGADNGGGSADRSGAAGSRTDTNRNAGLRTDIPPVTESAAPEEAAETSTEAYVAVLDQGIFEDASLGKAAPVADGQSESGGAPAWQTGLISAACVLLLAAIIWWIKSAKHTAP